MRKPLFLAIVTFLMIACTGNKTTSQREPQPSDTLYTAEAAKQLQESKAHEYAARYQLQEERLNTEREQAAKKRIGLIATLLGIMLLIVAFYGCSGITSVTLPESLNTIKGWAFYNCAGLTHVILPNSVTEIGSGAFLNCDGLTSVTLSDALTEIPGFAFMRCTALPSITIPDTCLLVVPCGTLEAYTEAWGSYFTQIVEVCGQSINDIVTDDIKVYVQGGRIVVENADNETLRVFDVAGHQVVNQALPTGIYFVRIGDRITRKVAVIS